MLTDNVVVVTGGAGYLGSQFTEAILKSDGVAVIADIDSIRGEKLRYKLAAKYPNSDIEFFQLDTSSKNDIQALINFLEAKYKRIDAVVNNAYPKNEQYGKDFFEVEYAGFCDNLNRNLGGYFLISQMFASFFKKNMHGNIINISSIYGALPPRFELYKDTTMTMPVEYALIKAAVNQLTTYMAAFLKGTGVRVNTISPGGILDSQPASFLQAYKECCSIKGMLDVADIIGTLIFLLSEQSKYINGQNITVDDGFSL